MNRDSGTLEEKLEVFTSDEKRVVYNMADVVIHQDKNETRLGVGDWDATLHKRGFEQIIEDYLQSVESGTASHISSTNTLLSHKICEEVVQKLKEI